MKSSNSIFIPADNRRHAIKPSSVIMALSVVTSAILLSCAYPVYDGDDEFLEEQQSVWQYLKVFSIYQDRLPESCGSLSPNDMFRMINDTLKGGRYTGYRDNLPGGGGGGGGGVPVEDLEIDTIRSYPATVLVSISQFTDEAWKLFDAQASYLEKFQNIVIDLWDNGGGLLTAVENMLCELLPSNTEFIQYSYRDYDSEALTGRTVEDSIQRTKNKNKKKPRLAGKNIAVLMNGGSASASEIMASALKDGAGAHLIGERSYGKGIGQVVVSRTDRKVMSITHMRIRGISERTGNYHRIGIVPDTVPEEYFNAMDTAAKAWADSISPRNPTRNDELRRYLRSLYCAIKAVEPSYLPPSPVSSGLPEQSEQSELQKAVETERQVEMAALVERAMKRGLNRGKVPIGVYVVSEPDPLK